ncbi:hypothetical protein PVAND_001685 [Polypedilum vanderplanki]|uniref:Uncharacterized protein n=1 Tax=Polypedilum vanderplanki TaxID=319348 RepID=A0A9J6BPZ7_POLVA|nr:hypothetical protein PVAND_001685 [Polypedilum vanderplanki]
MSVQLKQSAENGLEYLKYFIYLELVKKSRNTKMIEKFITANIPLLNFLDFVIEKFFDDVDKIEKNHEEVMAKFDNLEKILERSFASLTKEIKMNELTRLQSKITTAFNDFLHILAIYGNNENELAQHLEKFIDDYRKEKFEINIVNYLRQITVGTEPALKQIYNSFIQDSGNLFNSKKTSPNLIMLDFYKSLTFMIYRGNLLLSYCYNLKDQIRNSNSNLDQEYIALQTNEAIKNLKTAFKELITENDSEYLSSYIDLRPQSNRNISNFEKFYEDSWWDRFLSGTDYIFVNIYTGKYTVEREGFVITGIKLCSQKFKNTGKVIYFQIQIGKLLKNGEIDKRTIYWQKLPSDLDEKYKNISSCYKLLMDDLCFTHSILTGIQFIKKEQGIYGLKIFGKEFANGNLGQEYELESSKDCENFRELVSFKEKENLKQNDIGNVHTYKVSKGKVLVRTLDRPVAPGCPSELTKITFMSEEIKLDFPSPLSGLGLFHFTNDKNFAGYIKPFLKTFHFKHFL